MEKTSPRTGTADLLSNKPARAISRSSRFAGGAAIFALFVSSTLLTPLYDLYRARYGLTTLVITLIYAVYVIGNLVALLFLGRLSDHLGRRPVVLAGLVLAGLSTILFLVAAGSSWLFAGRIVSGCAVGAGSGAATAWISESLPSERRSAAASIMTAFNFAGLTLGPVLSGLLVQYAPWPMRLPFAVYLGLIAAVAMLALAAPETLERGKSDGFSLKPRLGVPRARRLAFAGPATGGFAAMAVVGYYAALGPTMIHQSLGIANRAWSGMVVAGLFAVATVVIVATRKITGRKVLLWGLLLTPLGLALLLAAQAWSSLPIMLAGTALCGGAGALSYRGGLAVANALAPAERRAEIASTYFIGCFLGNALPVIGVGALSEWIGSIAADRIFAIVISLLAAGAITCSLTFRRPQEPGDRHVSSERR